MSISGLVLTLDYAKCERTLDALHADVRLALGEPTGARLPVVVEAVDERAARDLIDELANLDGVHDVAIAFVSFDQPTDRS